MKTKVSAFLIVLAAIGLSYAAEPTAGVRTQLSIGNGCQTIDISSHVATSVVISTKTLPTFVSVQNINGTYDVNCASHSAVSTTSTSGYYGMTVAKGSPGDTVVWLLAPGQDWWCMSQGANVTTRVTTCRGR